MLDEFLEAVKQEEFDEKPVPLDEFLYSQDFLNFPKLSDVQFKALEAMTQIYKYETLVQLWGQEEADRLQKSTQQEIILVLGKGCIAPYEEVYDSSSGDWVRVGDIHDSYDGSVAALDISSRKIATDQRTEAWPYGRGQMVRVTTSLGFTNDVYVGHKFLTWENMSQFYKRNERGHSPVYKEVRFMSPGDRIAVASRLPLDNPVPQDIREVELVGFWLGDGCMPTDSSRYLNMDFGSHEENSISRYCEILDELSIEYRVKEYDHKNMVSVISKGDVQKEIVERYGLWGSRAGDKKIPNQINKLPEDQLSVFISRLWGTDGCVYHKNNDGRLTPIAEYTSISEDLARGLQRLLLRLGIPSSIRSKVPSYTYNGQKRRGRTAYTVTVSSYECFSQFASRVQLLDKHTLVESGMSFFDEDARNYRRIEGDIYWDRITSVEPLGEGEYWDFTVANNHNYIGNGIISSNSGKDLITSIAFARIAYLLLCLRDPARYYGKPPGDSIDMLNVAINAQQAKNVFFKYFKSRIKLCPWFNGKWDETADSLRFDKNVTAYSGHSERESWEGYNFIVVVLDEISGFSIQGDTASDGILKDKTADSIYKMYKASVSSRFAKSGKLVLLSFPRYKGDFITKRYDEVVAEKNVEFCSHNFKIREDLPDNVEGNHFEITWEKDHIISYKESGVYAIKRATWEVNPTVTVDDLKSDFLRDFADSMGRFACMPSEAIDAFFKDRDRIEQAFPPGKPGPFLDNWEPRPTFQPDKNKKYYVHVDLAYKHDRAAVAIASVDDWVTIKYSDTVKHRSPIIKIDAVRYWTPGVNENIDIEDIKNFIVKLKMSGFNIALVTFDQWNSAAYREQLKNDFRIKTDLLSVAKPHYEDFALALTEKRIKGYELPLLVDELMGLRIIKGNKVDHQRRGTKDLSDAVVGAVFNVISHEKQIDEVEIEVHFGEDYVEEKQEPVYVEPPRQEPSKKMPKQLAAFISARAEKDEEPEPVKSYSAPVDINFYIDGKVYD